MLVLSNSYSYVLATTYLQVFLLWMLCQDLLFHLLAFILS